MNEKMNDVADSSDASILNPLDSSQIFTSGESPLSPEFISSVIWSTDELFVFIAELFNSAVTHLIENFSVIMIVGFIASVVIAGWARLGIPSWLEHHIKNFAPSSPDAARLRILLSSNLTSQVRGLGSYIGLTILILGLSWSDVLSETASDLLYPFILPLAVLVTIKQFFSELLSPKDAVHRLPRIDDKHASRLLGAVNLGALAIALLIGVAIDDSFDVLPEPYSLLSMYVGLAMLTLAFYRAHRTFQSANSEGKLAINRFYWKIARFLLLPLIVVSTIAIAIGNLHLAIFVNTYAIAVIWALLSIDLALAAASEGFEREWDSDSSTVKRIKDVTGLSDDVLQVLAALAGVVVRVVFIALALFLLAAPVNNAATKISSSIEVSLSDVTIGSFTFSPLTILMAIIAGVIIIALFRLIRIWLINVLFPRLKIEPSIANSLGVGVGYLGLIFAFLIIMKVSGIDLTNLAIIAGALSVGIGFGMQAIVSNFVSGLILLVERPVKIGDWIKIGDVEGIVEKINVRATEVRAFDKSTVLIPNSDLITTQLVNRMHRTNVARVDVTVGVDYDTDPVDAQAALMEALSEVDGLMSDPAPMVVFLAYGESSLDFRAQGYIEDISNFGVVRNDLHLKVYEVLKRKGIAIPFPHREIIIKNPEKLGAQ